MSRSDSFYNLSCCFYHLRSFWMFADALAFTLLDHGGGTVCSCCRGRGSSRCEFSIQVGILREFRMMVLCTGRPDEFGSLIRSKLVVEHALITKPKSSLRNRYISPKAKTVAVPKCSRRIPYSTNWAVVIPYPNMKQRHLRVSFSAADSNRKSGILCSRPT